MSTCVLPEHSRNTNPYFGFQIFVEYLDSRKIISIFLSGNIFRTPCMFITSKSHVLFRVGGWGLWGSWNWKWPSTIWMREKGFYAINHHLVVYRYSKILCQSMFCFALVLALYYLQVNFIHQYYHNMLIFPFSLICIIYISLTQTRSACLSPLLCEREYTTLHAHQHTHLHTTCRVVIHIY